MLTYQNMRKLIKINLYCREIFPSIIEDSIRGNQQWLYFGILMVPDFHEKRLVSGLTELITNNEKKIEIENISYDLLNERNYPYADKWLQFFLDDNEVTSFYLLGIHLDMLNPDTVKSLKNKNLQFWDIYKFFFRSVIQKAVKSCFPDYNYVIIQSIYHEEMKTGYAPYFPWQTLFQMQEDDEHIKLNSFKIEYLPLDYSRSRNKHSLFLQYFNLLSGLVYNTLHYSEKNRVCTELTLKIKPFADTILFKSDEDSYYHNKNRLLIEFYPKTAITNTDLFLQSIKEKEYYYKKRDLRINQYFQPLLFS